MSPQSILRSDFEHIFGQSTESLAILKNKSLLLTGGTGFFGKWILGFLNYANSEKNLNLNVYALSRSPQKFLEQMPEFNSPLIHFITGDIRTFTLRGQGTQQGSFDFVIHAATDASAKLNQENPDEMFSVTTQGTRHVLDLCWELKPQRILLTSSGAVYGVQNPQALFQSEAMELPPLQKTGGNPYAEGKKIAEQMVQDHAKSTGQIASIARCFAFVGPYLPLDTHFAIGNFVNDCLQGRDIVIRGDGTAIRSYLYAADLVVGLLRILTHGESGRPYNLGSDQPITILETAEQVSDVWQRISGQRTTIQVLGKPQAAVPSHRYVPDVSRARSELGIEVTTPLGQAIEKTFKYYRNI